MSALSWCSLLLDPMGIKATKTVAFSEIHMGLAQHDLAVMTVRGEDPSLPEFQTGVPCHIVYGWNPIQIEDFYGYVSHVTPPYERTEFNATNYYMDVVCVSASYIYKDFLQQIWTDSKISDVVSNLAVSGMFSIIVEGTDIARTQLSSPGRSAWSFLRECTNELGWMMSCNKTNFRFMSVDLALSQNQAIMPTFRTKDATVSVDSESISNFNSLQGETIEIDDHVRAIRVASNIDLRTGQMFTVQNNASDIDSTSIGLKTKAPFFKRNEVLASHTQVGAQARLDAETQRNRFHIQAKATVSGDSSVVQGIPIVLLGLGSLNSGVWFVEEVVHRFSYGVYALDLVLGRDGSGDGGQRTFHANNIVWVQGDSLVTRTSSIPPTVLVNGQWRAAWQNNQVVNV